MYKKYIPLFHFLFWIFVFFYTLDSLEFDYGLWLAATFSAIEVIGYAAIFYINLYVLIPKLLKYANKVGYFIGIFVLLVIIIACAFIFDVGYYYYDSTIRIISSFVLSYFLYIMISFLYWYVTLYQRERNNRLAIQYEKLQAEMLLLKSQVSPHFLFNSLNNIYSLSVVKHDNAPIMIEKLSDILRYIIYEGTSDEVYLDREVELMNNYVDLQLLKKLQAEKNIKVKVKGVQSFYKIAPLILINVVENCFKHSNINYNKDGFLEINLEVENERLFFSTTNSYKQSSKNTGIGLKNTEQQLQHYYPDKHELTIEDNEGVFKVEIQIDLKQ
jgi:two-component system, LytTR family, sensor kinase